MSTAALRLAVHAPCGSLRMRVNATEVSLRCSGALWIEAEGVLVVADLHLEKGSAYASRGQLLPPYDTAATLERLELEVEALRPRAVVLLGDSFHDRKATLRLAAEHYRRVLALARAADLVWIVGNHDREGLDGLPGETAEGLQVASLSLRHDPVQGAAAGEVAGHLHPCAKVRGPGGVVRRRCFLTDGQRLIMPAFGAYAGGLNARDAAFGGLFASPPIAAALGRDRVYPIAFAALVGD